MSTKKPVAVEIYGHHYALRGEGDERYVQELARYVDRKIRDVAGQTKVTDMSRLAILSAINIAHDFFRLREEQQQHQVAIRQIGRKTRDIIDSIEVEFEDLRLH